MKAETMAIVGILLVVAISVVAVVVLDSTTGQAVSLKRPPHPVPPIIPGRSTHAIEMSSPSADDAAD